MLLSLLMMSVCFGAEAPKKKESDANALTQQMAQHSISSGYETDTEYKAHQVVSKNFFCRPSRKKQVFDMIEQFKAELANPTTPVDLNGLSSRTRIMLIRELTALTDSTKKVNILFTLNNQDFSIVYPTEIKNW